MSEPVYGAGPTQPVPPSSPQPAAPSPQPSLLHEPPHTGHPATYPATSGYPTSSPPAPVAWSGVSGSDRNWAVAAHLSGFVAAWFALGFLGSLVVLLTEGQRRPFVRRHAVEALNFNLSVLLWCVISALLVIILVGFVMLAAVGVLYLVATILGALAASRGEDFRYPLTIRFVS
jgi:uncharacterized protein